MVLEQYHLVVSQTCTSMDDQVVLYTCLLFADSQSLNANNTSTEQDPNQTTYSIFPVKASVTIDSRLLVGLKNKPSEIPTYK